MIVEPVGAHRLVPVTRDLVKTAGIGRTGGAIISRCSIDTVPTREDDGIVIIVKLVREEEGAGKAVVLRSVMSVVFVSRNRVDAEASVLVLVNGESVTEAEEDWARRSAPYMSLGGMVPL